MWDYVLHPFHSTLPFSSPVFASRFLFLFSCCWLLSRHVEEKRTLSLFLSPYIFFSLLLLLLLLLFFVQADAPFSPFSKTARPQEDPLRRLRPREDLGGSVPLDVQHRRPGSPRPSEPGKCLRRGLHGRHPRSPGATGRRDEGSDAAQALHSPRAMGPLVCSKTLNPSLFLSRNLIQSISS